MNLEETQAMLETQSVLIQHRHCRDGIYTFSCFKCAVQIELPFSFNWMIRTDAPAVFELPEACPVKFCWACGKQFGLGKIVR